jgi:predicted nucleic acid-binding protein
MPPPFRLSARDAFAIVELMQSRMTTISLTSAEYLNMLRNCAGNGMAGGVIYDAIHVTCAKKVKAKKIYTLDRDHFVRIDPLIASSIVTP